MISKTIIILAIAAAFVLGSVMTGTIAYATPNGQPFDALQAQVNEIVQNITPVLQVLQTTGQDSFFDVFTEISVHDEDIANLQGQIDEIESNPSISSYIRETTELVPEGGASSITVECDAGDINVGGFLKGSPAANRQFFAEYDGTEKFTAEIYNRAGEGDIFATVQAKCLHVSP